MCFYSLQNKVVEVCMSSDCYEDRILISISFYCNVINLRLGVSINGINRKRKNVAGNDI